MVDQYARALQVPILWLYQGRGKMTDGYSEGPDEALLRASTNPDNLDLAAMSDKRFGPAIVDAVRDNATLLGVEIDSLSVHQWRRALVREATKQLAQPDPDPPPTAPASVVELPKRAAR